MVSSSLGGLEFAIVDGKPQWKERGADSFNPFKGNAQLTVLDGFYIEGTKSYNVSIGDAIFICCVSDGDISSTSGLSDGTLIYSVNNSGRTQMRCYEYKAISTTISISFVGFHMYFIIQVN